VKVLALMLIRLIEELGQVVLTCWVTLHDSRKKKNVIVLNVHGCEHVMELVQVAHRAFRNFA